MVLRFLGYPMGVKQVTLALMAPSTLLGAAMRRDVAHIEGLPDQELRQVTPQARCVLNPPPLDALENLGSGRLHI